MSIREPATRLRSFARQARDRVRRRISGEGGFVLLESIIAISLITVIMSAVGVEYVHGLAESSRQRAQQGAAQVADSALETIRSLHPSDLLTGRSATSVATEFSSAPAAVVPYLANMVQASDTSGNPAVIPTTGVVQKPSTVSYTVTDYLGWCYIPSGGSNCGAIASGVKYLRAVVAVTWSNSTCGSGGCSYITSTLVSTAGDPTFQLAQPLPAAPVITDPGAQTVAVNDNVDLQLLVNNGTGVPAFSWLVLSGSLPTGLTLSALGEITGTVGGSAVSSQSATVQVTDAFLRTDTQTITWQVLPPLAITSPGNQANTTADTVNLQLAATGGTGTGYVFTDPSGTLPPGLSLNAAGKITGTPTKVGTYTVQLTVKDSTGTRSATVGFTWTVTYPPVAATNPGTQVATVNTAVHALTLKATGGDGTYVWSASGLPSWLTLNASTGVLTGTPTATGSYTVNATVSDPTAGPTYTKTVTFTWSVVAKPTVTAPAAQTSTLGNAVSVSLTTTCADSPCTYVLTNGPSTLSIDGTGKITGNAGPAGTYTASVTVTDAAGATATSSSFAWTVYALPSLGGLTTNSLTETTADSSPISYTCPAGGCTVTLTGAVPGVGLSLVSANTTNNTTASLALPGTSGFFYVTGLVQNSAVTTGTSKAYSVGLSIKDSNNTGPTASTATWTAYTVPTVTGLVAINKSRGSTITAQAITYTCPAGGCTVFISGGPSGPGLDTDTTGTVVNSLVLSGTSGTVYVHGTISSTATQTTYPVVVSISDVNGAVATVSASWKVT